MTGKTCTFCGDPATESCTRKHLEWIIVLPSEIAPGDIWRYPIDGRSYAVASIEFDPELDGWRLTTAQKKAFYVLYANLPNLVKRLVPCGWPRCDLHCGKCMMYRESEDRRELLGIDKSETTSLKEKRKSKKRKDSQGQGYSSALPR